jgi:hypothetical protein
MVLLIVVFVYLFYYLELGGRVSKNLRKIHFRGFRKVTDIVKEKGEVMSAGLVNLIR